MTINLSPLSEELNALSKGSHIGCYKDTALQQSLFVAMETASDVMSIGRCLETCKNQGYNLAALKVSADKLQIAWYCSSYMYLPAK